MSYLAYKHTGNSASGKTKVWEVWNTEFNIPLGLVKWKAEWRKYCFFVTKDYIFDSSCLEDIFKFLDEKNIEHKQ